MTITIGWLWVYDAIEWLRCQFSKANLNPGGRFSSIDLFSTPTNSITSWPLKWNKYSSSKSLIEIWVTLPVLNTHLNVKINIYIHIIIENNLIQDIISEICFNTRIYTYSLPKYFIWNCTFVNILNQFLISQNVYSLK